MHLQHFPQSEYVGIIVFLKQLHQRRIEDASITFFP